MLPLSEHVSNRRAKEEKSVWNGLQPASLSTRIGKAVMGALWFAVAAIGLFAPLSALAMTEARSKALAAYEQALADPSDEAAFEAYLAILPKVGERYVVEGDLRLTEEEVQRYLLARASAPQPVGSGAELLVALAPNGQPSFWRAQKDRLLTYAVSRDSFPNEAQYEQVVDAMAKATADWETICPTCGIDFQHVPGDDAAPSLDRVRFIVEFIDAGGDFIAAAFFPHDPRSEHRVVIDPSYFTESGFDPVGVLRHELGHTLGYRHEHTRGTPGCFFEDTNWKPLTPYDPHSVMHYFCGGAGSLALEISNVDEDGHRELYGK